MRVNSLALGAGDHERLASRSKSRRQL